MTDERMIDNTSPQDELPDWLRDAAGNDGDDGPQTVQQRVSTTTLLAMLVVVAIIAVLGYALYDRQNEGASLVGEEVPNFGVTVYDTDQIAMPGERLTRDSLRGQVIVINFWADYCIPCQDEAPMFERVWNEYKDRNVVFLGVNTENPLGPALDFLVEYGLTYPSGPDEGAKMEEAFNVTGIPETFVINTNGVIEKHFISSPSERDFRAAIDRAMEG
jgi:cytochrome c biogenesis protein CcmG, thiol:disulfide interchange protein DsbE